MGVRVVMNFTTRLPKLQGWEVVVGVCLRRKYDRHSGVFSMWKVLSQGCLRNCRPESAGGEHVVDPRFPRNGNFSKVFSSLDSQHPVWS